MGQVVFYGSLGVASAEIMGGIKATQCASGFILDAGLQMGINAIVKTYLSEKFTTKQLVKEISLPSATVSCATSALVNNCGTKCAGISGFALGFGDDVWNQIKSGKSLTEVELSQSALNGLKQGILNIIVQKAVGFGISKFTFWKGKYTAKQVEDALEDLEKNPGKYGVGNENIGITLDATKLGMDDATILAAKWIKPENGWYDVVVHGTPDNFMVYTGDKWVSYTHRDLLNYLRSKGYRIGIPIRLISCNSGIFPDAIAKNLANKIGADVKAPKGLITVFKDGSYKISNNGNWQTFNPSK